MLKQLNEHIKSKKSIENNVYDTKNSKVKVTRSSRANGLSVNIHEDLLNQDCEKRTSRLKTSLNKKEIISNHSDISNSNVIECDLLGLPADTHQKQILRKADAITNSICYNSNDEHSCNEDSRFRIDESKLSLPTLDDELTIKFSQGPLTSGSQEEPICDVRWNYGSPEIIKKIKKRRGHFSAESVKSTVANFNHSHHKPQETSSNFAAILHARDFKTVTNKGKLHKAKERSVKKKQVGLQEMVVSFLQDMSKKQITVYEENTSSQLELSLNADQHGENPSSNEVLKTDINYWSDEDLFKDDSFLIEATCNAEKYVNPSLKTEKKSDLFSGFNSPTNDLRNENGNYSDTTFSDKSSIVPSSCASTCEDNAISIQSSKLNSAPTCESFNPVHSKLIQSNKIQYNSMVGKTGSDLTKKSSGAASFVNFKSSEKNNSNASGNNSLKSSEGDSKVVLKKYYSFDTTTSPRVHIKNTVVKANGQGTELNSPLRKTLSFDSSNANHSAVPKASVISYCPGLQKNCIQSNVIKSSTFSSALIESQSLNGPLSTAVDDVNLPDDLLQKFLEPDEILDSQETNNVKPTVQNISAKGTTFQLNTVQNCVNNNFSNPQKFSNYSSHLFCKNSNRPQSTNVSKLANSKLSSVSHVQEMKKTFKLVENISKKQNSNYCGLVVKKSSLQEPGQKLATPLKIVKINGPHDSKPSEIPAASQELSDSFIENAFDDSFLKDEAVFESQILPILDLVESEALKDSQCSQHTVSSPPAQCSLEEIERKRQAALQKRVLSLSQKKHLH